MAQTINTNLNSLTAQRRPDHQPGRRYEHLDSALVFGLAHQ